MRAVLLDGAPEGHDDCRLGADALLRALSDAGFLVERFELAGLAVAPCLDCEACWTRTPGSCPVQDASRSVAAAYAGADVAALYSPLAFGAWSHTVKKCLDRMACLLTPFAASGAPALQAPRYARLPSLLGACWTPAPDPQGEAVFARLVEANARTLHAPSWQAVTLVRGRPWSAWREACRAVTGRLAG